MTKLGIIGAMQEEIETLLHLMEKKTEKEIAGSVFHDGVLEGLPVTVVGKVNAALCTQILCDLFDVTCLVNTGIAGSLCNDLDIGDLVVSRDAMYHDVDATVFGYPMGKVPQMDVTSLPADDALMAYAFAAAEGEDTHFDTGEITDPVAAAISALYLLQNVALYKALKRGVDPDRPNGLSAWIRL